MPHAYDMQSGASAHPLAPSGKKLLIGKLLPTLSRRGNEVVITQRAFGPTKFIPLMAAFNAIALMVAKPHSLASVRCQGNPFSSRLRPVRRPCRLLRKGSAPPRLG